MCIKKIKKYLIPLYCNIWNVLYKNGSCGFYFERIQTTSTRLLYRPKVEGEGQQALAHVHILYKDIVQGIKFCNNTQSSFCIPKTHVKRLQTWEALHIHYTTNYYLCTHIANMSHAFLWDGLTTEYTIGMLHYLIAYHTIIANM